MSKFELFIIVQLVFDVFIMIKFLRLVKLDHDITILTLALRGFKDFIIKKIDER